jgi:hypothetical protein
MPDEKDHGQGVAGAVVLRVQIVGVVAMLASVTFGLAAIERAEFAVPAGLMMIASAVAFGMLANAVLRR